MLWEWFRHVRPERTLLVVPDAVQKAGLTTHFDRFPGATLARFSPLDPRSQGAGVLDERTCRAFLEGLDVVYSAETFYDWRFVRWASEMGVATVCHVMPEFARPEWMDQPTMWWAPTRYRMQFLPLSTRLVPVPIARDRFVDEAFVRMAGRSHAPIEERKLRWLHIAGAQTIEDRNGTQALFLALRSLQYPTEVTVTTQTPLPYELSSIPPYVDVQFVDRSIEHYWMLYALGSALVIPRRYAGLCLPALEAMGAGLAVLMSDMPPQDSEWPVATVPVRPGRPLRLSGGLIETGDVDALALAQRMDEWARDHTRFEDAIERSSRFATENSWSNLLSVVLDELAFAVKQNRVSTGA